MITVPYASLTIHQSLKSYHSSHGFDLTAYNAVIDIHVSPSAAEAIPVYFVSVGLRLMSALKDPVPLIDKCRIVQIVLSI